jgi:hypothetical protein
MRVLGGCMIESGTKRNFEVVGGWATLFGNTGFQMVGKAGATTAFLGAITPSSNAHYCLPLPSRVLQEHGSR